MSKEKKRAPAARVRHKRCAEQRDSTNQRLIHRATSINDHLLQSLNSVVDMRKAVDKDRGACEELANELALWEESLAKLEHVVQQEMPQTPRPNTMARSQTTELLKSIDQQKSDINSLESRLNRLLDDTGATNRSALPCGASDTGEQLESARELAASRMIIAMDQDGNPKYALTKDLVTIGRAPDNDINIGSVYVSRLHARIICDIDGATIEDMDSSNGITVNSRPVRRHLLHSGDMICLGRTRLQFIDLSQQSANEGWA